MILLLADENCNGKIVRGLLRSHPGLGLGRVQDVGLMETEDPLILEWAAREGRILLTHDVRTIVGYAYERVRQGLSMPGVLEVKELTIVRAIVRAIEEILIFALCSREGEWENQVVYIPL